MTFSDSYKQIEHLCLVRSIQSKTWITKEDLISELFLKFRYADFSIDDAKEIVSKCLRKEIYKEAFRMSIPMDTDSDYWDYVLYSIPNLFTKEAEMIAMEKVKEIKVWKDKYLPFEAAREFVRDLQLTSQKEWFNWCSYKSKPNNIPAAPNTVYESSWISWGDWLGNEFYTYEDCKIWAKQFLVPLGINSKRKFFLYCSKVPLPTYIPSNPPSYFGDSFLGWGDFFGTKSHFTHTYNKEYVYQYETAKKLVRDFNKSNGNLLSSKRAYELNWGLLNDDKIPKRPNSFYSPFSWIDFLDQPNRKSTCRMKGEVFSYNEAKIWLRDNVVDLGINTQDNLFAWLAEKSFLNLPRPPKRIPSNPHQWYKKNGNQWISYGDFLSTYKRRLVALDWDSARDWLRINLPKEVDSRLKYRKWIDGGFPNLVSPHLMLPKNPDKKYAEWKDWSDYLGVTKSFTHGFEGVYLDKRTGLFYFEIMFRKKRIKKTFDSAAKCSAARLKFIYKIHKL